MKKPSHLKILDDVRGGIALDDPRKKRTFVPATAQEIRRARAVALMNEPEVQAGWADLMTKMGESFVKGADVCECEVPNNGAEVLQMLGYSVTYLHDTEDGQMVSVSVVDPYTSKMVRA